MPIQVVIFDIDGTLIDSVDQHAAAWVEALGHFGHEVSFQAVRAQIGKGGDQLMPVFLSPDFIEQQGEALERFRGDLFKRRYLDSLRPFPGVPQLFERLRAAGKRPVLASSAKAEELERYKAIAGIEACGRHRRQRRRRRAVQARAGYLPGRLAQGDGAAGPGDRRRRQPL